MKIANFSITEDTWWTILGAVLAIIGCIFQAIGFIIQKIAHNRIEKYNLNITREISSSNSIHINQTQQKDNINDLRHNTSYDADEELFSDEDITESLQKSKSNILSVNDIEMKKQGSSASPITKKKRRRLKMRLRSNSNSKKKKLMIKSKKKTYVKSKFWLLGFFLNGVVGSLLNIIALNYAPQSVVLPLSATTLVGNTILATKYLNEPFPIQDIFGVGLVIIGSIGTIMVGPKEQHDTTDTNGDNGEFTVANLEYRWKDITFLLFFLSVTFIIIIDFIMIQIFNRINKRKKNDLISRGILLYEGSEIGDHTKIYKPSFYLISYPLIAAYMASVNFLVLKSFTQIITSSIKSLDTARDNFTFYLTYVYIGGIFLINFLLEMFRQKGLRAFGAIYVIPIYQVLVITMGTTMGAIYFKEMKNMKILNVILFLVSVFVTCLGVIILALSKKIDRCIKKSNLFNKNRDRNRKINKTNEYMLASNDHDSDSDFNNNNLYKQSSHSIENGTTCDHIIGSTSTKHKQSISSICSDTAIANNIDNMSSMSSVISSSSMNGIGCHSVNAEHSISSLVSVSSHQLSNNHSNSNININNNPERIDEKSTL